MKFKELMKKAFSKEGLKTFFKSYIWLMILIFVLDIVTKWVVVNHFGAPIDKEIAAKADMIPVINNFLYIGRTYNLGAAWSMGASVAGKIIWMIVSLVLSAAFIAAYVLNYKKMTIPTKVALALMIAGAVGNLIDRAFYWKALTGFTGVIDWISFHFGSYTFPMFNIADSSLVIGVIILLIVVLVDAIKEGIAKGKTGAYKYSPEDLKKKKEAEIAKENEENNSK